LLRKGNGQPHNPTKKKTSKKEMAPILLSKRGDTQSTTNQGTEEELQAANL